jgi:hypothetical protein
MMPDRFLEDWSIAVSISDSPDLTALGFAERHLCDVMVEVARHLIAAGATLVYGGDLRRHGYTELLFEVAARYHKAAGGRPCFTNVLPWPVHIGIAPQELVRRAQELGEHGRLVRLAPDGSDLPEVADVPPRPAEDAEWGPALSAMRRRLAAETRASIVLGGAVQGYRGRMPGIAEETLLALEAGRPVYLLGGFGGCTGDICVEMGLAEGGRARRPWEMRNLFSHTSAESLRNGLTPDENRRLARTAHTDELVVLILRGLHHVAGR